MERVPFDGSEYVEELVSEEGFREVREGGDGERRERGMSEE